MTEQWILTNLTPLLAPDKRTVILEDLGHGIISVTVADLVQNFGALTPTYANLSATPQASAGWQQYFDAWKAAGYIS